MDYIDRLVFMVPIYRIMIKLDVLQLIVSYMYNQLRNKSLSNLFLPGVIPHVQEIAMEETRNA